MPLSNVSVRDGAPTLNLQNPVPAGTATGLARLRWAWRELAASGDLSCWYPASVAKACGFPEIQDSPQEDCTELLDIRFLELLEVS